jgi:hypothetical protein
MRRPIASCLHDDSHKAANERPLLQVSHSPLCILLIDKLQYEIQGNIDKIGRLIYREYHILHFKNLQTIFQSKTILRAVIGGPLQVTNARLNRLSALFLVAITTPVHSHTLF